MRKLDLANEIRDRVGGLTRKECTELIDELLDTIRGALGEGQNVKISGFGSFQIRDKSERIGRNPHTGEQLTIPGRRVLTFRPSHILRRAINRG